MIEAPIVINNSKSLEFYDVDVHQSLEEAETSYEHWLLEEPHSETFHCFDINGYYLRMLAPEKNYSVIFELDENQPPRPEIVKDYLIKLLHETAAAHGWETFSTEEAQLNEMNNKQLAAAYLSYDKTKSRIRSNWLKYYDATMSRLRTILRREEMK